MTEQTHSSSISPREPRRDFLTKAAAVLVGGIVGLVPIVAGAIFFLDPLRRKRQSPTERESKRDEHGFIRVTTTDALPDDGTPQKFAVVADRVDAWNYYEEQRIGNVILRKVSDGPVRSKNDVVAFSETCPHLGCSVDYRAASRSYYCPCHNSLFALDGARTNRIPPRGMDQLDVDVRGSEIWVKYERFLAGIAEKIPVA